MQLIPNGADEREFKKPNTKKTLSFRKKYKIKPNNLLILNVSNHTGIKGHKETIKSFQKANIDNATLMFIGDINKHAGCYNSCKKSEWIQNNIFSIINRKNKKIIVTNLDRKETIDAFFASDIFLFLSNLECSPLVLFESAAAGKPFISSNCGNAKEIAKWTKSGLIVESKQNVAGYTKVDILDAIKKIEKLVANKKLSKKLGNIGRKVWQKRFTWKKITKKYETLYTNLLKK
jgi:glycosyltransferase involved in cell wall biosynthesis